MYDIYGFFRDRLPTWAANTLCAVWYAILIFLILYLAFEPTAEFNYLNV